MSKYRFLILKKQVFGKDYLPLEYAEIECYIGFGFSFNEIDKKNATVFRNFDNLRLQFFNTVQDEKFSNLDNKH